MTTEIFIQNKSGSQWPTFKNYYGAKLHLPPLLTSPSSILLLPSLPPFSLSRPFLLPLFFSGPLPSLPFPCSLSLTPSLLPSFFSPSRYPFPFPSPSLQGPAP